MSIHTIKSFSFSHRDFPVSLCYQAGLSLIELMISIAIGLLLLAGVTALIVQQNSTRTELDKSTRQIENGRYAIQSIQDELQFAGYYGEFPNAGTTAVSTPVSLPNPCATTDAALLAAIPLHIQGYDSPTTVPSPLSTCLNNANHLSGTDILVIRRTDTTTLAPASAAAGQAYMQTTLGDKILGIGTTTTYGLLQKDGVTLANLRKYFVKIYFISPCSVPSGSGGTVCTSTDDNGRPIPTLKLLALDVTGGAATFTLTPLVEGIENLQIDYGIDTDGDGAPDSYTTGTYSSGTTAMTTSDWANVVATRVSLLARNNEATAGYTDTKTYTLGSTTIAAANDAYKRHVFTQLVRLINPSGRREQ